MEDLLASIRRAIHDDIGDMPSSTAGQSRGVLFKGNMRELRVKSGAEASVAAAETQGLREKINHARAGEIEPEPIKPRRLADPPHKLRPSFAEIDTQNSETVFWDEGPPALASSTGDYPPGSGMLSAEAEVAAGTAFTKLANTLLTRPAGGGQPIEEMTREILRGMLKHWLDANLPGLVERLVREEIERVARRR